MRISTTINPEVPANYRGKDFKPSRAAQYLIKSYIMKTLRIG